MKLLIATDGLPASQRAIAFLARVPLAGQVDAVVLHVRQEAPMPVLTAVEGGVALWPPDEPDLDWHLVETCRELFERGISATPMVVKGNPSEAIRRVAVQEQADLVVVGTRHLNPAGRWLLGSVSHDLATHADVPLLIVP